MSKKIVFALGIILFFTACTSTPIRSKWTDPSFRVAIDPTSLPVKDYVRVQQALVESGKFFVVDRGQGFNAVVKEQNIEHGVNKYTAYQSKRETLGFERFADKERYARIAKLYGVGAIIIGNVQCRNKTGFWTHYSRCLQNLAIVNANTGEVVAAVEGEDDSAEMYYEDVVLASDWKDTVNKLNNSIPTNYSFEKYDSRMQLYREEVKEESQREREGINWQ